MPAAHLRVSGIVQGVGFRWFVREKARRLDLAGWVRNLPNGDVEIAAAGEQQQLTLLLDTVREGPPGARVDRVVTLPDADLPVMQRPFQVMR